MTEHAIGIFAIAFAVMFAVVAICRAIRDTWLWMTGRLVYVASDDYSDTGGSGCFGSVIVIIILIFLFAR